MDNFIITSHGWSASNWVAHALNLHKDITCTHSARNELANDINLQSNKNLKKHINDLHQGYLNRQSVPIQVSYEKIYSLSESMIYGSVHLYRLRDLPVIAKKFKEPDEKFNVMNLVRNPIDLVWSGYGQFKDLFRYDINELYWTTGKVLASGKEFVFDLADRYELNLGDFDILGFIGACAVLGSIRKDLDALEAINDIGFVNYIGAIKMEDITSRPEILRSIISTLSSSKIEVDEDYIKAVYSTGAINKHKHDDKKKSPKERYNSLTSWQKEVLNYYLEKFKIAEPYRQFYDLSFLPTRS